MSIEQLDDLKANPSQLAKLVENPNSWSRSERTAQSFAQGGNGVGIVIKATANPSEVVLDTTLFYVFSHDNLSRSFDDRARGESVNL